MRRIGIFQRRFGLPSLESGSSSALLSRRGLARFAIAILALIFLLLAVLAVQAGDDLRRATRDDLSADDLARVRAVTEPAADFSKSEAHERLSAGAATALGATGADAFAQPTPNLAFDRKTDVTLGSALFDKLWVSSPSSTQASDGLGPLFNARACQSCHVKGGRGHPPLDGDATSFFLRLARTAETDAERRAIADHATPNIPDPVYGKQLQDRAVPGLPAEGRPVVTYEDRPVTLADGTTVTLRQPRYSIADLGFGPLGPATTLSPRMAPALIGLGLIEAIDVGGILAHADPNDLNHDGIRGRPNWARDPRTGKLELGRFGWKAQTTSVRQQVAEAFDTDIGISTPDVPVHTGDCTKAQTACLALPNGVQLRLGTVEAPPPVLDLTTLYAENLAVPARRDIGERQVLAGKAMFYQIGCAACHTPKFVTRRDAHEPAHAFQLIWPYSDFLLHDMGVGLADGQPVGDAGGQDWRTPPLWGIGLASRGRGQAFYLHDGRARTLTEAILWHGGEAQGARDRFAARPSTEREALVTFLESL